MVDITNRWALVTGSSRGIGRRVASALARQGCRLILHSRQRQGTADLEQELTASGHPVAVVAAELDSESELTRMIAEVKEITGNQLDILYNNAAIMTAYQPLFEPTIEDYRRSFMVNSIVPAKLADAFLPAMLEQDWGRIVQVTSGISEQPQLMAYSCSKAALDRYVRDMVPTLRDTNVLMNLLDPGWLRTDLGGQQAPNDPDSVLPGALVPVLLEQQQGSGKLYRAQDYSKPRK
jgi:3-oxoacyl-[acyl-carrier protein] reductase